MHYAVGYLINQVQPRLGMVTHTTWDEDLVPGMVAGIRQHWKGLLQFGAPDGVVVNVTKDAIWTRKAAFAESSMPARPSKDEAKYLFDLSPTHLSVDFPAPRHTIMDVQEEFVRDKEIDPSLYYPEDMNRPLVRVFPPDFKISIPKMVGKKIADRFKRGSDD